MDSIVRTREIPVVEEVDVAVCGGGPGGIMAALAAARGGARTALVERYGFVGGMATAGLVAPISEFMYNGRLVVGGIPWEFVERLVAVGGAQVEMPLGNVSFSVEAYKLVAQRMLLEAGVALHLHAYLSDCRMDGGRVTHAVLEGKSGPWALGARRFIDATGDGDLAALAGVPMASYPGPTQPASLCFLLGGVDTDRVEKIHHAQQGVNYHIESLRDGLLEIARTRPIPSFGGPWMCYVMADGYVQVNMTRVQADMLDERDRTRAECRLREDVHALVAVLKENFEPFRNAVLLATAPQAGVRETRHIRGVHVLTGEEYRTGVHFEDTVARGAHPIDIHAAQGSGQKCEFLEEAACIPYRSLVAEGFPNLAVASRCFSADREASASARVMGSVMGIGQAAGAAAALGLETGRGFPDLDVAELRRRLLALGAVL